MSSIFSYFANITENFDSSIYSLNTDKLVEYSLENPYIKNTIELLIASIFKQDSEYKIITELIQY